MKIHEHVSSHHSFMYLWIVGALLVLGGLVYSYVGSHPAGIIDGQHEGDVRTTVAGFGNQLNSVSLLSPRVSEEIQRAYRPYVTPELLTGWIADPSTAPGRGSSSPWPDHIEVDSVTLREDGSYEVMGRVMLRASDGDAGIIPVALTVASIEGSYLITKYEENPQEVEVATEDTVTLSLNETGSLYGVRITPRMVTEDSRCPQDVACIQAGQVRIQAELIDGMGTSTMEFTLGAEESISSEVAMFWLTTVTPEKASTTHTEDAQYRFTFTAEKR